MQIVPFPAYYQSVYTNFDFTSFSLISCIATVAHLQFRLGPLKPIFIPNTVSVKFKRLITSTLETLLKFAYLHRVGCLPRILQTESPKTNKSFDNYSIRNSPPSSVNNSTFLAAFAGK